jgi:hypothetical protein
MTLLVIPGKACHGMASTPSPDNPPLVVRPFDVFDCDGCGQRLQFDARGFVAPAQLEACRGLCDWSLVERGGEAVTRS